MKFDFAIGNPPYQEDVSKKETENGQKRSKSIFQYFQIDADKITNDGSVLIYPGGRWIHQSGKGMKQFGYDLINDEKLARLDYYPNSREVFGTADIGDGISIVVKNNRKKKSGFEYRYIKNGIEETIQMDNPGESLMILNPKDVSVMNNVDLFVVTYGLDYLNKKILSQKLFGIESDFVEKNSDKVRLYNDSESINYESEIKLFTNDKAGKSGRAKWYITDKNVIKHSQEYISQWQVVVSSANAGGQKRDNQIEIVDNHSAFGRARVALSSFKTYEEAVNFYNYANTYIVKFAFLMTDEALTSLGKRVPDLLDYTNNNKIVDFSKDLDNQLFKLMKLSDKNIEYVKEIVDSIRQRRAK